MALRCEAPRVCDYDAGLKCELYEMFAKINHVAIVSQNYALLARFYEAVFKMKASSKERASGRKPLGTAMSA